MTVQRATDRQPADVALPRRARPMLPVWLGLLVLLVVLAADGLVTERSLAAEGPPDLGPAGLFRIALIALGSVLVVAGLTPPRFSDISAGDVSTEDRAEAVSRIAAVGGSAIACGSALLLALDPSLLNRLVVEDQVVEWGSAALSFAAAVLLLVAALRYWNHRDHAPAGGRTTTAVLLVAGAGVAALLGFEEVSWFQRVLDIESPDAFLNRNRQGEINFHNFATGATGNGYYVGAFLALVAVPYWGFRRQLQRPLSPLQPLVPTIPVLVAAAPAAAIVYEMWNIAWIQMTFWMGLAAVSIVAVRSQQHRRIATVAAVSMVVTIATYLRLGDTMVRSWDDTEVKELVIPFALALYGYTILWNAPVGSDRRAK